MEGVMYVSLDAVDTMGGLKRVVSSALKTEMVELGLLELRAVLSGFNGRVMSYHVKQRCDGSG